MDTSSSVSSLCGVAEDVHGVRRQRVSLSSVDSEPILKRCRRDAPPRVRGDGNNTNNNNNNSNDDADGNSESNPSDSDGASYTAGTNCEDDYDDVTNDDGGDDDDDASAAAEGHSAAPGAAHHDGLPPADTQAALHDADGGPLLNIPIDRVSAGMVATVAALIARDSTVIADNAPGALVMDVGTRLCLADGTVVGVITAVMGPVTSCAYAVVCLPAVFVPLHAAGRLVVGADLCYDLSGPCVIYDPLRQCDVRRGTDASYINDEELPPHARPDFSDDEAERRWEMSRRRDAGAGDVSSDDEPVDIDWAKISALEGSMCDAIVEAREEKGESDGEERGETGKEETRVQSHGADEPPGRLRSRLVIPPWVAAADVSKEVQG